MDYNGKVAVIGMAGRFPGAKNLNEFWSNLQNGVESLSTFTDEELLETGIPESLLADENYVKKGFVLDNIEKFDAKFFNCSPSEARMMDPQIRFFLECAWETLENAGYDPEKYEGKVGVFSGMGMNTYIFNFAKNRRGIKSGEAFQTKILNDKDFLGTWTSYKLNLTGPSVSVQTACSTSLVAVHMAIQSLLVGECDIAIAGAVSIGVPQKLGHYYYKGGIESVDGHCRAFDADGRGTMNSSGIGLVALQRLDDAVEERSSVDAVILGSAINNDGALKMSYTAPSIDGQSSVIAEALEIAGVSPESISYVEAHGTGTPLGDPTEIAALSEVYRSYTDKKGFCGIGSVKTNIGHLDTAAGIAGLIKTVLAMKHRKIPPSLHYKKPNPEIDFANSPFYVNACLRDWNSEGSLRAGVSSFGIGGTNAHLVMESFPELRSEQAANKWKMLMLSAKDDVALDQMAKNLAAHLKDHPQDNLDDVAYTLQVGRKEFECRRVVVCDDREKAISLLEGKPDRAMKGRHERGERDVVFMFPGQGTQYANMASDLYETESVFREELDRCFHIVSSTVGIDLKSVLFGGESTSGLLNQTEYTQPAIFSIEYSLAILLLSWGIKPKAMIGHSIGEYVAACISGVFSLESALHLVTLRGQLIKDLPAGKMLAVRKSETELMSLLDGEYELAAFNSPKSSVISGEPHVIDAVYEKLATLGIKAQVLRTSHAFHSSMMDPILEKFEQEVKNLELMAPKIPYISNVTGDWIREDLVIDPQYWVKHLRGTVLFSKGVDTLLKGSSSVLLEIGPGQALSSMVKEHDEHLQAVVLPTIRQKENAFDDGEFLRRSIARLWISGVKLNWGLLNSGRKGLRLHLPTYPMQSERYWIDAQANSIVGKSITSSGLMPSSEQIQEQSPTYHPRPKLDKEFEHPASDLEKELVELWQRSFEIESIGVLDNFFELGGNSLQALLLIDLVIEKLGVDLTLSRLFSHPTVRDLAEQIAGEIPSLVSKTEKAIAQKSSSSMKRIEPDLENRHKPFPLNDIQHAYWLGRTGAFSLGDNATHIYLEVEIHSGEVSDFNKAWNKLIERHDMLRAIVLPSGEQQILETVPEYQFKVENLVGESEEKIKQVQERVRQEMSHNVISLEQWPLFEIQAIKSKPKGFRLCFSIDILVADAWSINMLIEQWLQLYQNPYLNLPKLELSFRDYVIAEEKIKDSEVFYACREYWFNRIESLPPAPQLPLAQSPEAVVDPEFKRRSYELPKEKWDLIKQQSVKLGVTPSAVLLTIFSEVLALWSRAPHFVVNLTLYNRLAVHEQVTDIVGDFTSLTLLEVNHSVQASISERIKKIQKQLWEDLDNRFCGAITILREMTRRNGSQVSMPVVFTSTLGFRPLDHESSDASAIGEEGYGISQTTQVWLDHQVMEWNGKLRFNWDTVESLFPESLIDCMFDSYCGILEKLVSDNSLWNTDIAPLLMPSEQSKQLKEINNTRTELEEDLLQTLFEKQVALNPKKTAIVSLNKSLTYQELYDRAISLAVYLREQNCAPNDLVAIVMDKSVEQMVAVMGILFSGAAYLPIDPSIPEDRFKYLLKNSEARVILTLSSLEKKLKIPSGIHSVSVDTLPLPTQPLPKLESVQSFDDLAYVIYTSGSTGTPKGVMIPHRGAANTVLDINRRFNLGSTDRVIALSALNFDLSVFDIFGTLSCGATLVMPEPGEVRNPEHWTELIKTYHVTFWNTVPALMQILVDYIEDHPDENFDELRLAMLSGDWIPPKLPKRMMNLWPNIDVVSAGGPTECSIWSACHPIVREDCELDSIPYGKPLDNQEIHILNGLLQPCPLWVPGELYIAGDGLAKGYLKDGEKTDAVFIEHPVTRQRLYKSGDLGRYMPNGDIEFLGRSDFQVNINGHRIELGEIEAVLKEQTGIKEAVVVALGNSGSKNKTKLAAYILKDAEFAGVKTNHAELTNFKLSQPGLRAPVEGEERIVLPRPKIDKTSFLRRQSYRQYLEKEIPMESFNKILSGLAQLKLDDEPLPKHLYPSAGSLHAVRIYLYVKEGKIEGIEEGIYYYDPAEHVLRKLNSEHAIDKKCYGVGDNPYLFEDAAFSIFMVADLDVIASIYGAQKAREFAYLEAGYMGQILMEQAPHNLVGLTPIGYISERIEKALLLGQSQVIVHSMVGGSINTDQTEKWVQGGPLSLAIAEQEHSGDGSSIQQILKGLLPEYMIPSTFIVLDKLPLTENGKVDRKSLSSTELPEEIEKVHVHPRNNVEAKIAELWKEVLRLKEISVEDNFFELGGDSILIVRLHKWIKSQFSKSISIVDMFKFTTIAELAAFIGEEKGEEEDTSATDRIKKQKAAFKRQRRLAEENAQ